MRCGATDIPHLSHWSSCSSQLLLARSAKGSGTGSALHLELALLLCSRPCCKLLLKAVYLHAPFASKQDPVTSVPTLDTDCRWVWCSVWPQPNNPCAMKEPCPCEKCSQEGGGDVAGLSEGLQCWAALPTNCSGSLQPRLTRRMQCGSSLLGHRWKCCVCLWNRLCALCAGWCLDIPCAG